MLKGYDGSQAVCRAVRSVSTLSSNANVHALILSTGTMLCPVHWLCSRMTEWFLLKLKPTRQPRLTTVEVVLRHFHQLVVVLLLEGLRSHKVLVIREYGGHDDLRDLGRWSVIPYVHG
jgi:hypothetical protein